MLRIYVSIAVPVFALACLACEPAARATPEPVKPNPVAKAQPIAAPDSPVVAVADSPSTTSDIESTEERVAGNPEPKVPIYFHNVCPGEGCEFGEWATCDTALVHKEPTEESPIAFVLTPGTRFTAVTGDEIVTQAGKIVFSRPVKSDNPEGPYSFTPADTLYPLVYEGEGYGAWYLHGKRSGGSFFFGNGDAEELGEEPDDAGYTMLRPIHSEWWVKLRTKDGKEGWFIPGDVRGKAPHYESGLSCST